MGQDAWVNFAKDYAMKVVLQKSVGKFKGATFHIMHTSTGYLLLVAKETQHIFVLQYRELGCTY